MTINHQCSACGLDNAAPTYVLCTTVTKPYAIRYRKDYSLVMSEKDKLVQSVQFVPKMNSNQYGTLLGRSDDKICCIYNGMWSATPYNTDDFVNVICVLIWYRKD